ncbi:major facilitator superfamily domain-containing protein [Lophiotrema nucula]|uniref:Major facilitator superfamily domain-containing protein n=1 Tax=Lophiotrema nucula TaxID=690887 RepID=A0A6A5YGY9_9PLEO|nr:major facilitator superfamily domain-containing protein [Lophiotrema nucula]
MAAETPPALERRSNEDDSSPPNVESATRDSHGKSKLSWRFVLVFGSLCATMLLSALDATIITVALPDISRALHLTAYAWAVNAYTLSCTVFLLLIGQLADVFDRKPTMLASIVLFAVGSAICGAATSMGMLIAGRVVQGIGGGGIPVMAELIVSDLVDIEQRPTYLGLLLAIAALGTVIGPPIGGAIISGTSWRWIFYINLPLCGAALVLLTFVLRLRDLPIDDIPKTFKAKMGRVDWVGNALFATSSLSLLLGLTMGGNDFPWGSYHVVVPIVLGVLGLVAFGLWEKYSRVASPVLPSRLLNNYTAISIYIQGMGTVLFLAWITYFLIVYFQGVLLASTSRSSTELLPTIIIPLPFAIIGGILMSQLKRAREIHFVAAILMTIGLGCFSLFDASSSLGLRVGLQVLVSAGAGLLMATLLPAVQSQLPESDLAAVTALFNFMRSLGGVWGVTIPSIIFNARINSNIHSVDDPSVQATLLDGGAYSRASKNIISAIPQPTQTQVIDLYTYSLRAVWWAAAAFSVVGVVLAATEKLIILRIQTPAEKKKAKEESVQKETVSGEKA